MAEREEPELQRNLPAGFAVAGLLVAIALAERLEVARSTVDRVRDARGGSDTIAAARPEWWVWLAVWFAGVCFAVCVTVLLVEEIRRLAQGDAERFLTLAIAAIGTWKLWMVLGLASAFGAELPGWLHTAAHLLAIGLAIAALWQARGVLGDTGKAWDRASVVRMQLIVLVALVALVFLVPLTAAELADVLRAWGDGPYTRAANGIAGALLLGAVVRSSTYRFLAPQRTSSPQETWERRYTVALYAAWLAAFLVLIVLKAVLGLAFLAIGLVLVMVTKWAPPKLVDDAPMLGEKRLAATLGVVPLGIIVAGLSGAALDSLLLPGGATSADVRLIVITLVAAVLFGLLVGGAQESVERCWTPGRGWVFLLGIAAAFAACVLPREFDGAFDALWTSGLLAFAAALALRRIAGPNGAPLWGGAGVVSAVLIAVYLDPVGVPRGLGTFAIAFTGAAGLMLVLHALGTGGARRAPAWDRWWLPDRVPVLALFAVWLVAATLFPVDTFHQARTVVSTRPTGTLDGAVKAWMARQPPPADGKLSMVLIAASGGGAKASYWTDLVVDCMLGRDSPSEDLGNECASSGGDADRLGRVFLTSSVSGGSIGVYHLLAQQPSIDKGESWVDRAGGREVLSPIIAWGVFHDLPAWLLRAPTDPRDCTAKADCRLHADRALVQEAAVADFKDDIVPPDDTQRHLIERGGGPVPVFNGSVNGAEGRVLLSPLALAPPRPDDPGCEQRQRAIPPEPGAGSLDGHDVLRKDGAVRGTDVPLVTAALLSARFPVVAPPARLGDRDREHTRCGTPLPLPPVKVRDGGYVENTGVLTITDLLPQIRESVEKYKPEGSQVQIVVVSIDDDSTVLQGDPDLSRRDGPDLGVATRVNDRYLSQLARDRITSCQYPQVSYERISPPPHAGAEAATGWELSRTSRTGDLVAALAKGSDAIKPVDRLRDVLDGVNLPSGCSTASRP